MKIHQVHYKSDYAGIGASLAHPDGLAVVGHFLEVTEAFMNFKKSFIR